MCRKNPKDCKVKIKCECCKIILDKDKEHGKIILTEVDNQFYQQQYVIDIKGEIYALDKR